VGQQQAFGQAGGSHCASTLPSCFLMVPLPSISVRQVQFRQQVDGDGRARLPVRRNLQDRRAGQAAVGEQQVFAEARAGRVAAFGEPVSTSTSSAMPAISTNGAHCSASKVSGTSAGRGSTMRRPNCAAMR
jgi:hypothetical protein